MSSSPSHYRRQGRNAFYRGGDPLDHNPYQNGTGLTIGSPSHSNDWSAGWNDAKKRDDQMRLHEAYDAAEDDAKIDEFARLYNLAKERGLLAP